jgi:xanthine dehydrogenase YagS FAD-binding subunit
LPLSELFALPDEGRRTETALRPDELVVSLHLPAPMPGTRGTYVKAMDRKIWAFALAGVAAVLRLDGARITGARIVLTGVAPIPWRATDAERALLGAEAGDEVFARAAGLAVAGATPLRDNNYKVTLTRALVRRALEGTASR